MATPKNYKKPQKADWVREGGIIGDDAMERMEDFITSGSGVSDEVIDVGCEPNEKFVTEKKRPGVE